MVSYHTNQANAVIAHNVASEANKNTIYHRVVLVTENPTYRVRCAAKKAKREIGKM